MKKILTLSFFALALSIFVFTSAGHAPSVHAQAVCKINADCATDFVCASGTCVPLSTTSSIIDTQIDTTCANDQQCPAGLVCTSGKCVDSGTDSGTAAASAKPASDAGTKNPTSNLPQLQDTSGALGSVMKYIMTIFAWLLGIAAITLDNAVYYTVITMGNYVSNLNAIGVTWRILRDIGNIAFIFGFLMIGINIILGTNLYGWGQKLISTLLISAICLNFSLFATEAIIDVGNLFATQFYTQINGGVPAQSTDLLSASNINNEVISNKILSQLGLATIYGRALTNTDGFLANSTATTLVSFMSIILFLIAAFVMFSLAFILIARFVILIFVIIVSPIAVAGFAIPPLAKLKDSWMSALLGETMTAPVLLLLLYVALAIITDAKFLAFGSDKADWLGFVESSGGAMNLTGMAGLILSFIVAMGLLLAVVMYSKKLGAFGASWASKTAGKLTFGATAWGMRQTAGRASQRLSNYTRANFGGSVLGRITAGGFDKVAAGSFDVRGSNAWISGTKALGGVEAGEAQKGGFKAMRDNTVKEHEAYLKTVTSAIEDKNLKKTTAAAQARDVAEAAAAKEFKEVEEPIKDINKKITANNEEIGKLEKAEKGLAPLVETQKKASESFQKADAKFVQATAEKEQKEKEQATAQEQKAAIEAEQNTAETEVEKKKAEVASLLEAKEREEKFSPNGRMTEETEKNLAIAQQNLAASQAALTEADGRLEKAAKELDEKEKATTIAAGNHKTARETRESAGESLRGVTEKVSKEEEKHKLGTLDQVTGKLATSKEDLEANKGELQKKSKTLNELKGKLKDAVDAEKKLSGEISEKQKKAQEGYASSISGVMGLAYGPGGGIAAKKIIKGAIKKDNSLDKIKKLLGEKSEDDMLADAYKAQLKKQVEEEAEKTAKSAEPAAPTA